MTTTRPTVRAFTVALAVLASALANAQTAPVQKRIYCWDEGGRRVCGDALPPSATDRARVEFSVKSGLAMRRVERAQSDSERDASAEAARVARLQAEADAMQRRRDLAMIESYLSEADLRRAYGERIGLLDETLKASRLGIDNLHQSLLSLLRQAADQELGGEPVPKSLAARIGDQHVEMRRQQQILVTQQRDRVDLEQDMEASLARYRDMKGGTTPAPPATGA